MKLTEVKMRKSVNLLKEYFIGLTASEKVWFFIDNKVMEYLREVADGIDEISNLVQIQIGNLQILTAPHTLGWWRIYSVSGEIIFREPCNPQGVIFMKMDE